MKSRIYYFFVLFFLEFILGEVRPSLFASLWDDLSPQEREQIERGELIVREKMIEKEPWPELSILSMIKVSPLEAVAIFSDYEYQTEYVPNLIKAQVVKQELPTQVDVSFIMKTPWPVPNAEYITTNSLEKLNPQTFSIAWSQVQSNSTEASRGFAKFGPVPQREGHSIVHYQNFVVPKFMLAGLLKEKAISDMQKVFNAMMAHFEWVKEHRPELLKEQLERVKKTFEGQKYYENLLQQRMVK